MADDNASTTNATLTTVELVALSDRLTSHAAAITNAARRDVMCDLQLASMTIRSLVEADAHLRREVAKVAASCTDKKATVELLKLIRVEGERS